MSGKINLLFNQFLHQGTFFDCHSYGAGHIHETWLIRTLENDQPDYLLQKINQSVFSNIKGLMENIQQVTTHLAGKNRYDPGASSHRKSLVLIKTCRNASFYKDQDGNCWRMFEFIQDTSPFDRPVNSLQAFEAGAVIADFHLRLSDLKASLHDTIPRFHDLDYRLEQFRQACMQDPMKRCAAVKEDIDIAMTMLPFVEPLQQAIALQHIPLRVAHNDTKFNNILFDRENRAVCLIDLDTVMPGYIHFDYGDAIRILANTASEDEPDPEHVSFNFPFFKAFTEGYLQTAGMFLTSAERRWLHLAPTFMTFMIGLRFLTDYINGDRYFRIHRECHNLDRARVQMAFVKELTDHQDQIIGVLSITQV